MNRKTLEQIGSHPQGAGAVPFVAAGAVLTVLAALAAFWYSLPAALAVLAAGVALILLIYGKRSKVRTVSVPYVLEGDDAARFAEVGRACEALAEAACVWRVKDGVERLGDTAERVEVARSAPPGIRTNVEVWGLRFEDGQLYFMPDTVLLREDDQYRAISYASLEVGFGPEYRAEEGEAPPDADVIGHTWQYLREDGRPDRRFSVNPRLTEVMYGLLEITGPNLRVRLRVSSRNAAMRFARTLGTEKAVFSSDGPSGHRAGSRQPRAAEEEMQVELAYGILGLQAGSPKDEVTTAYRKLAKIHHPDLQPDLGPEARELAEARMRAINDAYTNLKRQAQ